MKFPKSRRYCVVMYVIVLDDDSKPKGLHLFLCSGLQARLTYCNTDCSHGHNPAEQNLHFCSVRVAALLYVKFFVPAC